MARTEWQRLNQTQISLARRQYLLPTPRMKIDRRHLLLSAAALSTSACATQAKSAWPAVSVSPQLPGTPLQISESRLQEITVCTRPFRPAGPRIEAERMDEKIVIHNYGHGGSGWSLSWACAAEAADLVRATGASQVAIIGAGVIGLTTALTLARSGLAVTIYAAEMPSQTRSARATGVWSPSSRIGLKSAVPDGFEARWEAWARASYQTHETYLNDTGNPVDSIQFYQLNDGTPRQGTPETHDFLHLWRRLQDLAPGNRTLFTHEHAFPVDSVQVRPELAFNIAAYTDRMVQEFLGLGGQMVHRSFQHRSEALGLNSAVIVNCTGYGAKALWGTEELVPVRGQINWMPAQPEARYGVFFKDVYMLSRRDGLVVQFVGQNDDFGYGIEDEAPDDEEMRRAIKRAAPLFAGWS